MAVCRIILTAIELDTHCTEHSGLNTLCIVLISRIFSLCDKVRYVLEVTADRVSVQFVGSWLFGSNVPCVQRDTLAGM
jgi:hypothetical protein